MARDLRCKSSLMGNMERRIMCDQTVDRSVDGPWRRCFLRMSWG